MRIGAKKRPFYRVVVVDERKKRTGGYLELLGTYNPLTEPKEIILKKDRIEHWVKQGAILSDGYLRITKQAPQKPPRKPKKQVQEKPVPQQVQPEPEQAQSKPVEEAQVEEVQVEETPAEVTTEEAKPEEEKVEEKVNG